MTEIFIDTETTGLPERKIDWCIDEKGYYPPSQIQHYNKSRIVSISWIIQGNDYITEKDYYIIPDGFVIPQDSINIHGITNEFANENGISITDALRYLYNDIVKYGCQTIIGHNIAFDKSIILSEMYRMGESKYISKLSLMKTKCTLKMGQLYLNKRRWVKLVDLHKAIFGSVPNGAHNSMVDTRMCYDCYNAMLTNN